MIGSLPEVKVIEALERRIGYQFEKQALLREALSHSSYGYERNLPYNERLEFLGDAVLGYVISRALFERFPEEPEGSLSKMKSVLVSAPVLSRKAREINLGDHLLLGKGERQGRGYKKDSILADAMEALLGAIAVDGGFREAKQFIRRMYREDIENASVNLKDTVDFKTLLQEKLQEKGANLPRYVVLREDGPAHNRRFTINACIGTYQGPEATGTSKKNAQQECAKLVLEDTLFWEDLERDPSPFS